MLRRQIEPGAFADEITAPVFDPGRTKTGQL
jgi:hypothetical protein